MPNLAAIDPKLLRQATAMLRAQGRKKFSIEAECFPRQAQAITAPGKYKVFCCSRRAGKSRGFAPGIMDAVTKPPYTNVFFLAPTHKRSRRILWAALKDINRRYGLGGIPNETEAFIKFPELGPDVHVYTAGLKDRGEADKIRGIPGKLWVLDECFPAGTLVDGRPIESIRKGDFVSCVDHTTGALTTRRVVRTMRRLTSTPLIKVTTESTNFTCTEDHPVFVRNRGYVHAKDIAEGELLCLRRFVREGALRVGSRDQDMRRASMSIQSKKPTWYEEDNPGGEEDSFRPEESVKPNAGGRNESQGVSLSQGYGAQASGAGREWPWSYGSGADLGSSDRMEDKCDREHRPPFARISELLQAGSGGRIDQDVYRGRWSEPRLPSQESPGREEDGVLEWVRVESVSRDEQGSASGLTVYNLEVAGAHTYFANGVLVHNCQDLREDVASYAMREVIQPGIVDNFGSLWAGGTPGAVKAGYFYDITEGHRRSEFEQHHWTWRDNPLLPIRKSGVTNAEIEAKILKEFGLTVTDPTWLREWCGLWHEDLDALVFKPAQPCNWQTAPQRGWTYILCFDIGANDADAIGILGWQQHSRRVELVSEFAKRDQDITDLAERLIELWQTWKPMRLIGDLGALGKKIGLQLVRRFGIPVEAADKNRKLEHIALLNAAIRRGEFAAPADSIYTSDAKKLTWDLDARAKGEQKISNRFHSDIADAVLYGFLHAQAYLEEPAPETLTFEQIEAKWLVEQEEKMTRETNNEWAEFEELGYE